MHLTHEDNPEVAALRGRMDAFYAAVVQATEEAVLNALVANHDMTGRDGNRTPALPHAKVVAALEARGVILS